MAFLSLVTLYANTRQPGQGTRNRLVGKAPCRVGCDSIHDIIGLARYFAGRLHTLPNRRSVDNDTGVGGICENFIRRPGLRRPQSRPRYASQAGQSVNSEIPTLAP